MQFWLTDVLCIAPCAGRVLRFLFAPVNEKCKESGKVGREGRWGLRRRCTGWQARAQARAGPIEGNHSDRGTIPWTVRQERPGKEEDFL